MCLKNKNNTHLRTLKAPKETNMYFQNLTEKIKLGLHHFECHTCMCISKGLIKHTISVLPLKTKQLSQAKNIF